MGLQKLSALLRFYFKIEPETLTDEQWMDRVHELFYCLEIDGKRMQANGTFSISY